MYVTRHTKRYLINMSHREMEALRKVVDAGLLLLEGGDDDGLWADIPPGQRITIGRWRGNPLIRVTGPKEDRPLSSVT